MIALHPGVAQRVDVRTGRNSHSAMMWPPSLAQRSCYSDPGVRRLSISSVIRCACGLLGAPLPPRSTPHGSAPHRSAANHQTLRVVHQQMSHPVALVLGVVARCMARTHPLRWPDLLHALLARLIHADHGKDASYGRVYTSRTFLHPALRRTFCCGGMHHISCRHGLSSFFLAPCAPSRGPYPRAQYPTASTHRRHRARPAGGSCASPSPSRSPLRRTSTVLHTALVRTFSTFGTHGRAGSAHSSTKLALASDVTLSCHGEVDRC